MNALKGVLVPLIPLRNLRPLLDVRHGRRPASGHSWLPIGYAQEDVATSTLGICQGFQPALHPNHRLEAAGRVSDVWHGLGCGGAVPRACHRQPCHAAGALHVSALLVANVNS